MKAKNRIKKLSIEQLKVESFVTEIKKFDVRTLQGGTGGIVRRPRLGPPTIQISVGQYDCPTMISGCNDPNCNETALCTMECSKDCGDN